MTNVEASRKKHQTSMVKEQLDQLRQIPRTLLHVWTAAPAWTLISTLLLIVQGLLPVLAVYLPRELVNSLVKALSSGAAPATTVNAALPLILAIAGVLLLAELLESIRSYAAVVLMWRTQDRLNELVQNKALALDLEFFESPDYYDQLQRASVEAIDRPIRLQENLSGLLQNTITLVAMAFVLFAFAWWIPIALLVSSLPAFWIALNTNRAFQHWRVSNTSNRRRLQYYAQTLLTDQAAAEVRLFDLGEYFQAAYRTLRINLSGERLQLARDKLIKQILASTLGLLPLGACLSWMVWQGLSGHFKLGDLVMFWLAMTQGQRLMRNLFSKSGDIYQDLGYLDDLFCFLDLQPMLIQAAIPAVVAPGLQHGLTIDNVTFNYPGSESHALKHFSLDIPAGKIVALMGDNGSGKSSLLKLLCRFYDPQEGQISWDGVDIRHMSTMDLRRRITVLFQRPFTYHETAADNIRFGDLRGQHSQADLETAAKAGGAAEIISALPDGYETVLGKWFAYTDLSVGEWQRLALARAFLRKADVLLFDDPTSAMDSWAEADWIARFRELVDGRTALMITHRFSSAMHADIIHVMAHGKIIESGNHEELIALGGRYAQAWYEQR